MAFIAWFLLWPKEDIDIDLDGLNQHDQFCISDTPKSRLNKGYTAQAQRVTQHRVPM
jgi:hypothetical protein